MYFGLKQYTGLYYREFRPKENTEQPSNIPDLKVEAPALYITGEKDYVFKFPEMENYIKSGAVKMFVPNLEIEYIPEGSHFISEQFPDKVNELILSFISKNIQDWNLDTMSENVTGL